MTTYYISAIIEEGLTDISELVSEEGRETKDGEFSDTFTMHQIEDIIDMTDIREEIFELLYNTKILSNPNDICCGFYNSDSSFDYACGNDIPECAKACKYNA